MFMAKLPSNVSATAANISGLIKPQTSPNAVFNHSTDSGMRFTTAMSPLFFSEVHSISLPCLIRSLTHRNTPLATVMPSGTNPHKLPPNILPMTTTANRTEAHKTLARASRASYMGS